MLGAKFAEDQMDTEHILLELIQSPTPELWEMLKTLDVRSDKLEEEIKGMLNKAVAPHLIVE